MDHAGYSGIHEYMDLKVQKLRNQQLKYGFESNGSLFRDICVHVNGWTDPDLSTIRQLVVQHGGLYAQYDDDENLTHIIASNLAKSKALRYGSKRLVVRPAWIMDSIKAGKLLECEPYRVNKNGQSKISSHFSIFNNNDLLNYQKSNSIIEDHRFADSSADPLHPVGNISSPNSNQSDKLCDVLSNDLDNNEDLTSENIEIIDEFDYSDKDFVYEDIDMPLNTDLNETCLHDTTKEDDLGESLFKSENQISSNPILKKESARDRRIVDINDPEFIEKYYANSRLHMISTWREELKQYAADLMIQKKQSLTKSSLNLHSLDAGSQGNGKQGLNCRTRPTGHVNGRKIYYMHVDMDCFFVSVTLRNRPDLVGKPVGITHARINTGAATSGSDLACCNYMARQKGLHNGMYVKDALRLCQDLVLLPYDFEAYRQISFSFYQILSQYSSDMFAVSCDEAYIGIELEKWSDSNYVDSVSLEITNEVEICKNHIIGNEFAFEKMTTLEAEKDVEIQHFVIKKLEKIATKIKRHIFEDCGCDASIGIGPNALLARLATRKAKPNGIFTISETNKVQFMQSVPIKDLPNVGSTLIYRLQETYGSEFVTCLDLQGLSMQQLESILGQKTGHALHQACRGIDDGKILEKCRACNQRFTCEITWGVRFNLISEVHDFISRLAEYLWRRIVNSSTINFHSKNVDNLSTHDTALMGSSGGLHLRSQFIQKGRSQSEKRRSDEISIEIKAKVSIKILRRQAYAPEPSKHLGHGLCDTLSKTCSLPKVYKTDSDVMKTAVELFETLKVPVTEIRGVGLTLQPCHTSQNSSSMKMKKSVIQMLIENSTTPDNFSVGQDVFFEQSSKPGENFHSKILNESEDQENLLKRHGYDPQVFSLLPDDIREEIMNHIIQMRREIYQIRSAGDGPPLGTIDESRREKSMLGKTKSKINVSNKFNCKGKRQQSIKSFVSATTGLSTRMSKIKENESAMVDDSTIPADIDRAVLDSLPEGQFDNIQLKIINQRAM